MSKPFSLDDQQPETIGSLVADGITISRSPRLRLPHQPEASASIARLARIIHE